MTSTTSSSASLPARPPRDSFWTRIAADIADAIARGVYPPGQRLPPEHALAEQYGVNRHTIRRSLADLTSQGLLRVTQGSGTYVEEFAMDLALVKRPRHHQRMALAGLRGALSVVAASTVRATAAQARALDVATRSTLLCLNVIGDAEGQPLHFSERFFPLPRFATLEDVVRETGSITAGFAAHGVDDYTRRDSRITAQMPEPTVASHLRQPVTRPVLFVESVNIDTAAVPIEYARTWFAGDRISLTVTHDE
ncbi:GntR family transcriptional regulator, phosphonate transport system regulatory protein [Variovorax sp. YR750]|uniref:phosphonate metabolism transcriptional regulator PhnF n=1 Tax=unclassified Variovorax TaxID=663243 RepID=UPI0008B00166|nr:phosphonate metabolism transcriptional regulator PhnF [Variovorax sp. YR750]SEL80051.1 GntR family transcriptional regulator, phosphonate transport system regulatory protein [Variovorax sp. YR750]